MSVFYTGLPSSYPVCPETGRPWPLDADAVMDWLDTASDDDLDWYNQVVMHEFCGE